MGISKIIRSGAALALLALGCSACATAAAAVPAHKTATHGTAAHGTAAPGTAAHGTAAHGRSVPVSVQADAAMRASGNAGPSSSILVPSSCVVTAASATVKGSYRGGLAPEDYPRYGAVIDLYVFTRAVAGYPAGLQIASPFTMHAPAIGGTGSWTVTVPIDSSLGKSARCMVAAQPTHDFQGAPNAY